MYDGVSALLRVLSISDFAVMEWCLKSLDEVSLMLKDSGALASL